jgi:hypothetical protein
VWAASLRYAFRTSVYYTKVLRPDRRTHELGVWVLGDGSSGGVIHSRQRPPAGRQWPCLYVDSDCG